MSGKFSGTAAAYVRNTLIAALLRLQKVGGAIQSTLQLWLNSEPFNAVRDFGADPTGATNSTTALFNFYAACIAGNGRRGFVPDGTYKITRSILAFDNGHVDTAFPIIDTGASVEYFVDSGAPGAVGPLLKFSNGTASSGAGKFWYGGSHGSIKLTGRADTTLTYGNNSEHGIELRGFFGTAFGVIHGFKLGGAAIHCDPLLFGGTNPDPYNVGLVTFAGIWADYCQFVLYNENFVGLSHPHFGLVRAIGCRAGVIYGPGTCAHYERITASACAGYLVDDGCNAVATGGAPSRVNFVLIEADGVQNGFRVNRIDGLFVQLARFVYRINHTAANPSDYWPVKAFECAAGASASVSNVRARFFHRFEAGGTTGDLGSILDFSSSNALADVCVNNKISDNGGIGVTSAMLVFNMPSSSGRVRVEIDGLVYDTTLWNHCAIFRATTADTIANSGYGTGACKLNYSTVLYDPAGNASAANAWYVVPFTGVYEFEATVHAAITLANQRVRLAFITDLAGVLTIRHEEYSYSDNAATVQAYTIRGRALLTKGHRLFLGGDQNSATATIALAAPTSTSANLTWSVAPVGEV